MKGFYCSLLVYSFSATLCAETLTVGGSPLEIPAPDGYAKVTPQMDGAYRLGQQMGDPMNDLLAFYVNDVDLPAAISGQVPVLERYFVLKVNKDLKGITVGNRDFAEIAQATAQQNKEVLKSVEELLPDLMQDSSEGISKEFDIDFAMSISQMVPLDPHLTTENVFSYSMYINYGVATGGATENDVMAATTTFINVSGKLLFLYSYGPQEDLEWTRSASKMWAIAIDSGNAQAP